MANEPNRLFTADDVLQGEPAILNEIINRRVVQCYVEFLQQVNHEKPHVVFKVNLDTPVPYANLEILSCRLSMEYTGDPGTFQIKLHSYMNSSTSAGAAFQFPVLQQQFTLRDWVEIFQGTHPYCPPHQRSDLTHFTFVVANPQTQSLDGCRDFISQCMIRLCAMGLVGWDSIGQGVPGITFINLRHFAPTDGFHDIIGNDYRILWRPQRPHQCVVSRLPLFRGIFGDPTFRRVENYQGNTLPYRPL